jgi:hypothetical protein
MRYSALALRMATGHTWPPCTDEGLAALDRAALRLATMELQTNSLSRATPRVAAADEMLKRFIQVAESDLERFLFEPALDRVTKALDSRGLQLGIIQRESMLVTNRLVARMDPSATGTLELGAGTDLLQAATQLSQLAAQVQEDKRSARTNKLTTAFPLLAGARAYQLANNPYPVAGGVTAAASLLGWMAAQPQPRGEVYALSSGDMFKVTPVFDPSGQALRFKFDYSATVRVQEPDGSTDPALPRVDRHTVNTEVQLSNLELREVSRFATNTRIGAPGKRSGGLPLLNQVPVLKDLPIVGYYYKEPRSRALVQESIILAQTSIYPTVSDIIGLLVDAQHRPLEVMSLDAEPGEGGS